MSRRDEIDLAEALQLSRQEGAALPAGVEDKLEDGYVPEAPPYGMDDGDDDFDEDIADLNNPDVDTFGETPLIGSRSQTSDIFGDTAESFGRATSPKLYAQAANFPTAVQYRVWRWENGIPVALGAIDAEATEEDMVRKFYDAMPKPGDGKYQFRFRPVDIRGKELGKEFTLNFSEHHAEVVHIRRQKGREREERMSNGDPILINQGDGGGAYAEEMGRMFEHAVESAERRTELLQETLEQERERLRDEEKSRYQERIAIADRSSDVVQKMTERLMETDKARSQEQLEVQKGHSNMLIQTLTTVFSQQQAAQTAQADRLRQSDEARAKQDREYFDRQRQDAEERRRAEGQEWERKRSQERDENERKRLAEQAEADRRVAKDAADSDRRLQAEKERLELERTRISETRKFELEALRVEAEKREREAERRRETEREEARRLESLRQDEIRRREAEVETRRERERDEAKLVVERERLELARREKLAREERERWRVELDEKRRAEREDWDRKMAQQREDAERRERADRERVERERQDFQLRMERERQEREDAANRRTEQARLDDERRKDESRRAEESRKAEMELKLKQMDVDAQRAREHQEKMSEQGRLDREARDTAQTRRDGLEREAREAANQDRTRQHEMVMRQMELEREQGREHQERMLQLQKIQSGGVGGLQGIVESLGMETPELLEKIFGGGGGEGGWSDAIPKVLGSIAELGKAALSAKSEQQQQIQQRGRRRLAQLPDGRTAQVIQTEQGPQVILPGQTSGIPLRPQAMQQPQVNLPDQGSVPEDYQGEEEGEEVASEPEVAAPEPIDLLARAKAADINLLGQKKARKAIRGLVEKLAASEQEDWLGLITEAITNEVSIYYYIRAVTVHAALDEAGAEDELQQRITIAMRGSDLIPDDVPYSEEDFAKVTS